MPVVIPFEAIRNSIIFKVEIEGETYNFFFDTGAGTIISPELKDRFKLDSAGSHQMVDFYGNTATISTSILPELILGKLSKQNLEVAVLRPLQNFQFCDIKIDGILGLEFFDRKVIQIDLRKGTLALVNAISYLEEDFSHPIPINYQYGIKRPYINIHYLDSTAIENVLFDTGALNDFLRLSNTSLETLIMDSILNEKHILDTVYYSNGKGLIGVQDDCINFKVHLPKIRLGATDFLNPIVSTFDSWNDDSILGAGILAKGAIVMDLINDNFYFKPYKDAILNFESPLDFHTLDKKVVHVKDSSKAFEAGVRKGQLLQTINGLHLDSMTLCEQIDIDWIEFYNQKNIQFTLQSDSGGVTYNYVAPETVVESL
ncbi:retropepsin-like aspartic protease [Algoriphagus sp. NG3]|uniref:retropepsin-like aspartic protease n=1 Tax=Algoriphagus sp. NG3 TaxID=3097546 RepID=UPI002A8053EE|nr:retropepsin-like aspartic protease [Algoriphagus sp. NG3]WPR76648.1 retropepsin-like aspartic protease [Algoriphagus sp. NG3]